MPEARAAILARIREQLGSATPAAEPLDSYESIPRLYTQFGRLSEQARTEPLLERLADYDAEVFPVAETAIAKTVADVLASHRESVLLAPAALPSAWLPEGIEILRDDPENPLRINALTRAPAVLTPCAGAIAETGTILLVHGPEQGRRVLTLLPDHHLCILRAEQIVETVSEGFALLAGANRSAITTISGPSATADIEMTRIRGVHGPRRLTVLLVSS
jgi:L-lactate dehydrogenase complex protein LldG